MAGNYYSILLPVPTDTEGVYTYSYLEHIPNGQRVVVPFGRYNKSKTGIVISPSLKPDFECKSIIEVYDEPPLFPEKYLDFINSLAKYYASPLGLALHGVISEKILNEKSVDIYNIMETCDVQHITLSNEQMDIVQSIDFSRYNCHLIKGVTGCGKTEIYQEAAKQAINMGRQVLYIVPEIALTPQLIERLTFRLGFKPLVFHSKLTKKERIRNFFAFTQGKIPFMIGARSALFIPANNVGLIIIDEEHENTFKQEEAPSYHLRDMAVLYASILDIPIILGSATPSIESIYNVMQNKYILHEINSRSNNASMPDIHIIDMKDADIVGDVMASSIYDKLSQVVLRNEQAVILLNRKGYSYIQYCVKCGQPAMCVNCSIGLVYFKSRNKCHCRYCGCDYENLICTNCGNNDFIQWGIGTEKVAEFLEEMFPNKVIRMDTDNTTTMNSMIKNLKKFEKKEANILVGTQIIAKGLHFPDVTFVCILGIDSAIAMQDFRATEKAFQLMVQIAGRSGRSNLKGDVYIQTTEPDNPVFKFLHTHNLDFYKWELQRRQIISYPPFSKMVRFILMYGDQDLCFDTAKYIANALKVYFKNNQEIIIYSPKEANITKIKSKYRIEILIKASANSLINKAITIAKNIFNKHKKGSMILKIDKDPVFMM